MRRRLESIGMLDFDRILPESRYGFSREDVDVLSRMPGGRPSFFLQLIGEVRRSPELVEGNAEGARFIRLRRNPPLIRRRKDQAGSLGTEEKTS